VRQVTIVPETIDRLQNHLMMFFTGFSRTASEIAAQQISNIPKKQNELHTMYSMVQQAVDVLNGNDLNRFGRMLDETWKIKRSLSDKIATPYIDELYAAAMDAGALGGKLLGAGGGGFVLLFVEPHNRAKVRERLKDLLEVPFRFENLGSQIIFYQPNSGMVG
jgi:D-glycero-alpha-D-manno-heptose-7-phosphate kinase